MGDAKARASSSARTRADEATAWLCKFCKKPNGDSLINRKHNKQCHACKRLKSQCFKAKFDVDKHGSRSPTTSRNDRRPTPTRESRDHTTRKLEGMFNKLTQQIAQCLPTRSPSPAASAEQQQPKAPDDSEESADENAAEAAAVMDIKLWRDSLRSVSAMHDSAHTTVVLGMPKADKLQELNRNLERAQGELRGSKPLACQQQAADAYLRKLHATLDSDSSKLADAEEALLAATAARDERLAAVAQTQAKIEGAKKQAAEIASKLAAEHGAPPSPPPPQAFNFGSTEWSALEALVRLVGNSDVHDALRSQGYPEDHLHMLSKCLTTVQAAGDEQVKRSTALLRTPTQEVGHRPPGTTDIAADMVAEGNALLLASLQSKCTAYEAQIQQAHTDIMALRDEVGSDEESTATGADPDGFHVKASKRRRKRQGDVDNIAARLRVA